MDAIPDSGGGGPADTMAAADVRTAPQYDVADAPQTVQPTTNAMETASSGCSSTDTTTNATSSTNSANDEAAHGAGEVTAAAAAAAAAGHDDCAMVAPAVLPVATGGIIGNSNRSSSCAGNASASGVVLAAANLSATNSGAAPTVPLKGPMPAATGAGQSSTSASPVPHKAKRRRRKPKANHRKSAGGGAAGPGNASHVGGSWLFQTTSQKPHTASVAASARSALVPYNTNVFLMADHGDGDSRPEDAEEFLRREFSSVYEDARTERLDTMSKAQLVREYLQLEANYDKLSRQLRRYRQEADRHREEQRLALRREDQERASRTEVENFGECGLF